VKRYSFLLYFLAILFILDAFLFRFLIWRIPNESAFDTEPHYSYLYRAKLLARDRPDEEFRVIVTGSSIAVYSVLEQRLESMLNSPDFLRRLPEGKRYVKVYVLAHQGQNSVLLLSALDTVQEAKPDLVIHPLNMVDFRIERPIALGIMDDLAAAQRRQAAMRTYARDLLSFPEMRVTGPDGKLQFFSEYMSPDDWSQSLMSVLFASYRYRDVAAVPFRLMLQNRMGRGHSFLHYAGIPVIGLTKRGLTATEFEMVWNEVLSERGLEFEAPPELFASAVKPVLAISRGGCPSAPSSRIASIPLKRGWQNEPLDGVAPGERLCFRVTPGYYSGMFDDRYGIRLARNTGSVDYDSHAFYREKRREDDLYRGYTPGQYRDSFDKRVLSNQAGLEYARMIRRAKLEWARREFDSELPPFHALTVWREKISACAPLIVVNSPENPISLSWYGDSKWYDGYLRFLSCDGACRWEDAKNLLKEGDFYDYHHLGYYGAEIFTDFLGERLRARPEGLTEGRHCGRDS
jgi:hypothetical protein